MCVQIFQMSTLEKSIVNSYFSDFEPIDLTVWLWWVKMPSRDLTNVTLVSDDTQRRFNLCESGEWWYQWWLLWPWTRDFGIRRTWLNGMITSPCPEVTLDTFGFLAPIAQMAILGPIMLCFGLKCIICYQYFIVLHCISFIHSYDIFCYLIVLHGIVLYCIVFYGILCFLMVSNSYAKYCML